MRLRDLGEWGLIERVRHQITSTGTGILVGIGDDAAVWEPADNRMSLASIDSQVDGVHFDRAYMSYEEIGYRAMAAALSDIAAMGGIPTCGLVALFLPEEMLVEEVDELYRGIIDASETYGIVVAGGDTVKSRQLALGVTVVGEVEKSKLTLRSGAKVGDAICVTGELGGSEAGRVIAKHGLELRRGVQQVLVRKFKRPNPRLAEGRILVEAANIHAMIDLSDGLAADLNHLAAESSVGMRIRKDLIPVAQGVVNVARIVGRQEYDFAIAGGEDFELLFTLPKDQVRTVKEALAKRTDIRVTEIGEVVAAEKKIVLVDRKGRGKLLEVGGYDHFRKERTDGLPAYESSRGSNSPARKVQDRPSSEGDARTRGERQHPRKRTDHAKQSSESRRRKRG
jgi:thiamine-monophosphate kinase